MNLETLRSGTVRSGTGRKESIVVFIPSDPQTHFLVHLVHNSMQTERQRQTRTHTVRNQSTPSISVSVLCVV
jgi:hypothetical protein